MKVFAIHYDDGVELIGLKYGNNERAGEDSAHELERDARFYLWLTKIQLQVTRGEKDLRELEKKVALIAFQNVGIEKKAAEATLAAVELFGRPELAKLLRDGIEKAQTP